jgi:hypothetical protein
MAFYQIAKIKFEVEIKTHPQVVIEEFDFKAPKWYKNGRVYTKDDGLSRYILQKIDKKLFVLTIEQLDLFGIELGKWNEKDYPERDNMIKEVLDEVEKGFMSRIKIIEFSRNAE